MKKRAWINFIILGVIAAALLALSPLPALSADALPHPMPIKWTKPVMWAIGLLAVTLTALLISWWICTIRPCLEARHLTAAAIAVVSATEAILGRCAGEDKWQMALDKMCCRGFDIENEDVLDALRAAWQQLDLRQITAGVKAAPIAGK